MKRAVLLGLAASLAASSTAYGFWTTAGAGSGTARTPAVSALTLVAGTAAGRIYPGGTADVATTLTNPNAFPIRVGSLSLNTQAGTQGFAVDAAHSTCGLGALTFAAQTNAGDGWTVPANGSLALNLTGALAMTTAAADACQGATFTVHLLASHDLGAAVAATPGLVSYWRLGSNPVTADNFTGTAGTQLSAHTGGVAAIWTTPAGTQPVLSDANRLRRNAAGWALSASAATLPGADYAVEADVVVRSLVAGDAAGVAGRVDTSSTSYYSARYRTSDGTWRIFRTVGGTDTSLASAAATLTVGSAYRLRFDLVGTALTLSVNGTVLVTATDAAISAAGKAGVQLGVSGSSVAVSDTTGLHLDNFRTYPNTGNTATDSAGGNDGTLVGTVVRNEPGAPANDLNGAVTLNGSTGAMQVASPTGLPVGAAARSVELWFKRGGTADEALFSYGAQSAGAQFGARLTAATNLRFTAFSFTRDFALPYTTSDSAWHHVAVTYDGTNVRAYLDGALLSAQVAALTTVLDGNGFVVGGGSYFTGSIDEVAVYSQALPATTVSDHYRIGHGS